MTDVDVGVMSSALPAVAVADGVSLMTPHDEAEVRQLLRRTVTPGAIRLAFTREPNYFAAEGLAGAVDRTFVLRAGGRVEGVGRLSTHAVHRNGVVRRIGYLGELRVAPETSNSVRALRDGYALLRAGLDADRVDGCFTSIAADNVRARRVLEHGARLGLPTYTPIAQLVTSLIPVAHRFRREGRASAQAVVDDGELTDFLERHACEAQLTPTWNEARWAALARHGINVDAVLQEPGFPKDHLPFVVTVESCEQTALNAALRDIDAENFHAEPPLVMPVLPGEEHVAPVH